MPKRKGSKQAHGNVSQNTVRPSETIYLQLYYLDPEGNHRPFPANFPVTIRYGQDSDNVDGVTTAESAGVTQRDGRITFPARLQLRMPWRSFTLFFGAAPGAASPPSANGRYVYAEEPGQPRNPGFTSDDPKVAAQHHQTRTRFFLVPHRWSLATSDWSYKGGEAGIFDARTGAFRHKGKKIGDIGTSTAPIQILLDPHWHFLRFEYFDRYHGPTSGSPPRAGHGRRVSVPPLIVEGFRFNADAAGDRPETRSNWTIDDPGLQADGYGDRLQCLPFILRRNADGTPLPDLRGATLGLRFKHDGDPAWVYSGSPPGREIRRLAANSPPVADPSAERLRYYDLPQVWKSRRYYTRDTAASPPAPGHLFNTLSPPRFQQAKRAANPLIFCLDDLVLCSGSPPAPLSPPVSSTRLAIFNHRFDSSIAGSTTHGLYDPQPHAAAPDADHLPRSRTLSVNNYISEYPDWTRLVVMDGDLFDVFDQRCPDAADPSLVVGARSAMRWMESMAPLAGLVTREWSPPINNWVAAADARPYPRRRIDRVPPLTRAPFFAAQVFYQQFVPQWQRPYTGALWSQGRFDIALLRCCDWEGTTELATNLHYLKTFFDFSGVGSPPGDRQLYTDQAGINTANRWNGHDAVSISRGIIAPSPPVASPPFKAQVVWFAQSVPFQQAHFEVTMRGPGGRDNRWADGGRGESTISGYEANAADAHWFPLAHESGHMDTLPDEYNERWSAASYGQLSFRANLPGDPYEPDGRTQVGAFPDTGMMNGNRRIRNRYFWHAAEWIRQLTGTSMLVQYRDLSGTNYDEYWLPPHPQAANQRSYYTDPVVGRRDVPTAAPWIQTDFFLYKLGKDHYSSNPAILTHASLANPYDGILVIAIRFSTTLLAAPALDREIQIREAVLSTVAASVRAGMSFRFFGSGAAGSPPIQFNRCLIQFAPQFVVRNYPNSSPPRPNVVAGGRTYVDVNDTALATQICSNFGLHYQLDIQVASPPAGAWNVGNRLLDIRFNNGNALDNLVTTYFPRVLGVAGNMAAVTAADVEAVVQQVLPGWTVGNLP